MMRKNSLVEFVAMTAAGVMIMGAWALAAEASRSDGSADSKVKFSDDVVDKGRAAFRDIEDARFDIFDGRPNEALKLLQTSKSLFGEAQSEAASHPVAGLQGGRIPVDGQIVIADDYVMTPEKQAHLDKANQNLKQGDRDAALAQLRLAAIDVNATTLSLSAKSAEHQLAEAIQFLRADKYYQANMALKALEDSVKVDMISVSEPSNAPAATKSAKSVS